MRKSIHAPEYKAFLRVMRQVREEMGFTQEEVAAKLGLTQSMYSKWERGERRIDFIELRQWCVAIGMPLAAFISALEEKLRI